MNDNDEFYIGWEDRQPSRLGARMRRTVTLLFVLGVVLAVALALAQGTIGTSVFEWGRVKHVSGILVRHPYPHLLVSRPGAGSGSAAYSSYHLVMPYKFGFDEETARRLDGRKVQLKGTLIYRDDQTMVEVAGAPVEEPGWDGAQTSGRPGSPPVALGRQTLVGEIVDSKCHLGVMNPGSLVPHRACAIRCISGGIPPMLLVRQVDGPPVHYLLVSQDGHPVNQQVLRLVAEPVEITGAVERHGELLILSADPATYRRVSR